jgi:hypothetical protein
MDILFVDPLRLRKGSAGAPWASRKITFINGAQGAPLRHFHPGELERSTPACVTRQFIWQKPAIFRNMWEIAGKAERISVLVRLAEQKR